MDEIKAPPEAPVFLSVPQAAKILKIDRTTVWRWVQTKRLQPAAYVGDQPGFDPNAIEVLAKSLQEAASSAA